MSKILVINPRSAASVFAFLLQHGQSFVGVNLACRSPLTRLTKLLVSDKGSPRTQALAKSLFKQRA